MVSGTGYDPSRTLREYSMSISNILDLERLAMVVVGLIGEVMKIQHGALFVVHYERDEGTEEGGEGSGKGVFRLRGARALGPGGMQDLGEELPPGTLSFDSAVATYLRLKQRPLTQYDVDLLPHFRDIPPMERAWLNSLDMDVYVPIYAKGEWIGLLALGPKASGDRYFEDDLNLLSTLADQTAVALENARLFDDLKVRNTEIERLNAQLRQANRELAQLDQAKSDFIDIASHELRTPLTQVSGYNEIMNGMFKGGSVPPEQGLEMTNIVRTAVHRLKEIVQTMCDVSQLDTQTLTLNQSLLSLAPVVDTAAEAWAEALQERKQTLTTEGLGSLPPIMGDRKRLEQVFSHLIQNGIKYTPDGGQIRITGRLLDEREQQVEIIVADTGIGLDVDDLERIFDKFYRVGDILSHSSGKTKFKGAGPGLGLTIARGIVEAHGGQIWAASTGCDEDVCPGSQFHVIFPVQPHGAETPNTELLTPLPRQRARAREGM
jgi:signal transduction histidine kinase